MNETVRQLERDGFTVSRTNGGHLRVVHPRVAGPVFMASTPSDWRAMKNMRAFLRRKLK